MIKNRTTYFLKLLFYMSLQLYFIFTIYNYNKNHSLFIIKNIHIHGNNYLNTKEISSLIKPSDNKSIFSYDLYVIKQKIEANPFIKTCKVSIKIPNELHVQIIERFPIALISSNNEQLFIDYENYFLPVNSKSLNYFPVPIINIKNTNTVFNANEHTISLIKYLFKNYNSMYQNLSEVISTNLTITLVTDDKTKIFINPNMVIDNIEKLKGFENSIQTFKNINDHKYINLIYKNQIVVKEKVYS